MIRTLSFFWVFLLCQNQEPSWRFLENTEIYSFLGTRQVAVSQDGETYLLDLVESKILHYAFDGKLLGKFGKKGQGPGEFFGPNRIAIFQESLLVYDYHSILEFGLDGTFIRQHRPPDNVSDIQRLPSGWLGMEGLSFRSLGSPTALVLYQENFGEKVVLAQWPSEKDRNPDGIFDPSGTTEYFNPVAERSKFITNHSGTVAVVKLSGNAALYGISIPKGAKVFEIAMDEPRIPFPKKLGMELFEREDVAASAAKIGLKAEPRFPEYLPPVAYLGASHLDQWVIKLWRIHDLQHPTQKDFSNEALRVFSFEGKSLSINPLTYHPDIMAYRKGFYFISTMLETEEKSIAIVPTALVETFLKNHSLVPEADP